eukprot:gene12099-13349_t
MADHQHQQETKVKKVEPTKRKTGIFTATSKYPPPIPGYNNFTEQVAGHLETHSVPCFMVDSNGCLLKVLEKGTKLMQNLVGSFERPCVMDIKIGKRTYDPFATPDKIHRESIRYDYQSVLGFRISGYKVFKAKTCEVKLFDRFHCKTITPNDLEPTFRSFFDLDNFPERIFLLAKILKRLEKMIKWFKTQRRVKFYCTSLLLAYDGIQNISEKIQIRQNSSLKTPKEKLDKNKRFFYNTQDSLTKEIGIMTIDKNEKQHLGKPELLSMSNIDYVDDDDVVTSMIDFTHTFVDYEGMTDTIDDNYIYGLQTIIKTFKSMIKLQV